MLSDILSDIDGIQLFTFYENEQVIELERALPNSVFIFDDIITENKRFARTYFSRGRHNLRDVFYLAQSYSKVPKQLLRDIANFIVLFKQDETNLKHVYNEHCYVSMKNTSFIDVAANSEILGELMKVKENIKRKYSALKKGKADIHSLVSDTLSPIIEPLKQHFGPSTFQAQSIEQHSGNQYFEAENSLALKINGCTMKACIIERFNRTLKEKMFREFTARGSHEWISILPILINEYNNSKHRTIGMSLVEADANPTSVEIKQRKIINRKIKFNIGDNVRINTYKGVFAKGYLPSWSTEIFKIVKINETLATTYQLQDYTGKLIAGCFYSEEILKTNYPNDYLVEKIILDTETWTTQHWIFKHSKSMEDNKSRKTNKWLERNSQQLSIEYGDVEYEELSRILNSLKFRCIYVKGEQKKQVLIEYIPHVALINIEDLACPRLDQLCDDETLPCLLSFYRHNYCILFCWIELNKRKSAYDSIISKYSFILKIYELDPSEIREDAKKLRTIYKQDLDESFENECVHFQSVLKLTTNPPKTLLDMSKFIKEKQFVTIFPYVDVALKMFLCNLASNCSTERSFSTLRRIKNYLRSSMSSERLNSLAVLNIEATLTKSLNYSDVIKTFAAKQARKKKLKSLIFPNDPALLPTTISYELKNHFFSLGPCQPSALELKNKIFPQKKDSQGVLRSFHETYYHRMIEDDKGSNDYKNIKRTIENHESFPEHLTSEMARGMYEKNLRIDSGMHERANRKVAENRQIVSVIIDALIFTARQNIALRGHNEKYTSTNRGNFLELCSFLSTYHPILKLHLEKLKENKINRLSFLSNVTQNKLLCILADMVRTNILKQVNKSGQFAVIIDTTTDVSNQEQFTVILRYIDEGKPQERLVALETAADSTGLGMFKMFCSITEKHNIKWKTQMIAQTYDGAASMQGKYSGLKTRIQAENLQAMFTWCFAHKLNLVIVDTCDCCINTKNFFGDVGALIEFMRARKRTAAFVECQEILNPKEQKRRIKRFSNTRWTSHDRALVVIQEKYPALLKALENISKANDSDRDTTSMAKNLISVITSFQFVLVLVLMRKIFSISTEVSNYLQSKSIDFMQAIKMVNVAKNRLKMVRTDDGCTEIINSAKEFATKNNLLQCDFKVIRARKKKIMPGELSRDEVLCSPADLFRCDVCFKVLDAIITSINLRFNDSQEILKDLSLLTSERMLSIKTKKQLPDNAFQQLSNWININTTKLQCEYLAFSNSLNDLFNDTNPTYTSKPVNKESEGTDQPPDISSEISDESEIEEASTTDMSCLDILGLLSRHNLIAAFPNLYLAYKALCIIPASSASAERSFSKVNFNYYFITINKTED
ncbi:hypothetical protein QTP88_004573 [Uroleucon formosanum]